jgi:hypothetical protein
MRVWSADVLGLSLGEHYVQGPDASEKFRLMTTPKEWWVIYCYRN